MSDDADSKVGSHTIKTQHRNLLSCLMRVKGRVRPRAPAKDNTNQKSSEEDAEQLRLFSDRISQKSQRQQPISNYEDQAQCGDLEASTNSQLRM